VHRVDSEYYTDAISYTKIKILETFDSSPVERSQESEVRSQESPQLTVDSRQVGMPNPESDANYSKNSKRRSASEIRNQDPGPLPPGLRLPTKNHGEVRVNTQVVGFKKIKFHTNENVGSGELTLPEQEMHTTAYWLTLPCDMLETLPYSSTDRQDGVHGLGNALRAIATLLVMCDGRDLGVAIGENENHKAEDNSFRPESERPFPEQRTKDHGPRTLFEPNIYLYDKYPGGIGFSEPLYRMNERLLANTLNLIANCSCQSGCPSCVGPAGEVGEKGREVALAILRAVNCS